MSIITRSYFDGILQLANSDASDPNKELFGTRDALDRYRVKYEREILIKTLGYPLYKLFMAEFEITVPNAENGYHTIKSAAAQKWKDLLNGIEYTSQGVTVVWRGIIFTDTIEADTPTEYNQSFIAAWVYAQYLLQEEKTNEGVGFVGTKAKNATGVSGRSKYVAAHNEAVKLINVNGNYEVSLYQFILDKNADDPTTYPDWRGEAVKSINRFGL